MTAKADTPDTSVVVAGLSSWHPDHLAARLALEAKPQVIAHVLLESYSVLTRLPAPRRISAELAWAALNRAFPGTPATLSAADARHLVATLAASGIGGGAVYDALVARTAMKAGLRLVTLDKRAQPTYVSVGADFDWLVSP